jgi:hypothetical protein
MKPLSRFEFKGKKEKGKIKHQSAISKLLLAVISLLAHCHPPKLNQTQL